MENKKHWIEQTFERCGAIQKGHFRLRSGEHTGTYLNKKLICVNARVVGHVSSDIADQVLFHGMADKIDIVVGPEHGGIVLAYEVSKNINRISPHQVRWVFTEKDSRGRTDLEGAGVQAIG